MCINETSVTRHISIDCFGISIDCFGLSRIKKWMILIKPFLIRDQTFSNFLAKTISVVIHSVTVTAFASRFRHIRNAKLILSLRRQYRLISLPRKNVKPTLGNSRVFQPQWLKQFDWLEYDAETKRLFCRT